ncbi:MAG: hypothetical protein DELT_00565 [Desulfovibrio sp.]
MEQIFYSLHEFMLQTKTLTYILMAGGIAAIGCFWLFLTGRDDDIKKF